MCPHRNMFVDYQDIRHERQYVRLGDEKKRILIHSRGTMCIEVDGRKIAYAETLHIPQLSAILLLTRVHCRSASGCSFLADNSGCFLTYPNFTLKSTTPTTALSTARPSHREPSNLILTPVVT
jgi:hypothetical protein